MKIKLNGREVIIKMNYCMVFYNNKGEFSIETHDTNKNKIKLNADEVKELETLIINKINIG